MTFQKQGLPLKRPLESEEGPQAQQQYLARLHELQNASDTGLADITKPQCSFQSGAFTFLSNVPRLLECAIVCHHKMAAKPFVIQKVHNSSLVLPQHLRKNP